MPFKPLSLKTGLGALSVFSSLMQSANGVSLEVKTNGGNSSSPLLYGLMFEVGSKTLVTPGKFIHAINRISTILEMVAFMPNCCKTMVFKDRSLTSAHGVLLERPLLPSILTILCHLLFPTAFAWMFPRTPVATLESQTPVTGEFRSMAASSRPTSGSRETLMARSTLGWLGMVPAPSMDRHLSQCPPTRTSSHTSTLPFPPKRRLVATCTTS